MAIKGAQHGLRTRGGYSIGIKLEGNWYAFQSLMDRFGPTVMALAKASQKDFAKEYKKKVQGHISSGGKRFGYPGHSPKYSSYKGRRGGGSRVLVWSGTMRNSVTVMDLPKGRVGVGIPRDISRERYPRETGDLLTVSEYANILEHGTFGGLRVPARPVFGDTFKKSTGEGGMGGMKGLHKHMSKGIALGLRAQGINITKI